MYDKLVNNLKSESRWLRLLFMAFYMVVGYFAGAFGVYCRPGAGGTGLCQRGA